MALDLRPSPTHRPAEGRKNLGIAAKSAAGPEINNLEARPADLAEYRRRDEARRRWRLQRAAQGLLRGHRVHDCQRAMASGSVGVMQSQATGCAHFSGVATCGSVWDCPVCAHKIARERKAVIQTAIALWKQQGGEVYLMTHTFRHDLTLPLSEGVTRMQDAQRKMKGKRAYKAAMQAAGSVGGIKALEVTYGENGWHPHTHTLVFARAGLLTLDAEGQVIDRGVFGPLAALWADAVKAEGLGEVNEHGFDIRGGDFAAEYVANFGKEPSDLTKSASGAWWTVGDELTRGHTKQGRRFGGATPFVLLRAYQEGKCLMLGRLIVDTAQAAALYVEYAEHFKGRSQLFWSPRLAEALDPFRTCLKLTPKEKKAAKVETERPVQLFRIDPDSWSAILRHDARWEVLYIVERYGSQEAQALIDRMRESKGRYRGAFRWADPGTGRFYPGDYYEAQPERLAA